MLVKMVSLSHPLELVWNIFSIIGQKKTRFIIFQGKTLSLLCSTLAWLERVRADQQLKALMPEAGAVTEWVPPVRHKIIYSSR